MPFNMTKTEREAFLADVHVGVLSINQPAHGPLSVPVWYDYEPGGRLWFITGRNSRKGTLLGEGTRVSLCAQTEEAPYRYVSVEGPVSEVRAADRDVELRAMARRYLGPEQGDRYAEANAGGDSILVEVTPEQWLTVDYGKRA
jgi:PPOX class probable F420-dependent enzyme